jgi:hypothetical protein
VVVAEEILLQVPHKAEEAELEAFYLRQVLL